MGTKKSKAMAVIVGVAAMALALPGSAFAGATQIDSGLSNTCAVKSGTGKVICWGTGSARTVPSSVGAATQVSVGTTNACAIRKSNGTVACWGSNSKGQSRPPTSLGAASQVSVGNTWACAIKKSNSNAVCWGGSSRTLGTVPTTLGAVSEITANEHEYPPVCAIKKSDGSISCWGGAWRAGGAYTPVWTAAQGTTGLGGLAGNYDCAINKATSLLVPSYAVNNTLTGGIGGQVGGCTFVPESLGQVSHVSRGDVITCAVKKSDSKVTCWASAPHWEGGAQPANSGETAIPSSLGAVIAVAVGGSREPNNIDLTAKSRGNACAIQNTTAKKVVCWGSTYYKQTAVPSTL